MLMPTFLPSLGLCLAVDLDKVSPKINWPVLPPGDLPGPEPGPAQHRAVSVRAHGTAGRARSPGIRSPFHSGLAVALGQSIYPLRVLSFTFWEKKKKKESIIEALLTSQDCGWSGYEHAL